MRRCEAGRRGSLGYVAQTSTELAGPRRARHRHCLVSDRGTTLLPRGVHGQPWARLGQARVVGGRSGAPKARRKGLGQAARLGRPVRGQAIITPVGAPAPGVAPSTPSSDPGAHSSWSPHPNWARPPPLDVGPQRLRDHVRGDCPIAPRPRTDLRARAQAPL